MRSLPSWRQVLRSFGLRTRSRSMRLASARTITRRSVGLRPSRMPSGQGRQVVLELSSKAGIELPPIDHVDFNFEPRGTRTQCRIRRASVFRAAYQAYGDCGLIRPPPSSDPATSHLKHCIGNLGNGPSEEAEGWRMLLQAKMVAAAVLSASHRAQPNIATPRIASPR